MPFPNDPSNVQAQIARQATRRRLLASAAALGVTSLSLPTSVMAASGVGPEGSYTYPGTLILSNPDTDPYYAGRGPIGGYWNRSYEPAGWFFLIVPSMWSLPVEDVGKTSPPFTYEYQLSPNNGVSWHTLQWSASNARWELLIPFTEIPFTSSTDPRGETSPYYFTETNVGPSNGYHYLINVLLRARSAGTVIDRSSTFWLG